MNIFQNKLKQSKAKRAAEKKAVIAISKKIQGKIKVSPAQIAGGHGFGDILPTYRLGLMYYHVRGKSTPPIFLVTHKNEKCGPNGCPIRKPIDYAKFFKEIDAALKKKV